MSESRVITGVVPPTGWNYVGPDGVRIDSWCLEGPGGVGLYDEVTRYRIENNLPVGNVHADVDEYICKTYSNQCHPGFVLFSDVRLQPIETNPLTALIDDASAWGRAFLHRNHPFDLVVDSVAQQRSEVCAGCPRNINYKGGCPDCVASLERIAVKVRSGRLVESTKKVHACDCHRFEASAAVFLKREELGDAKPDAPEFCWMKEAQVSQ